MAYETGEADLRAEIQVRLNGELLKTTIGRVIFNQAFPDDHTYINYDVSKKELTKLVEDCAEIYDPETLAALLDKLKFLGFHYATKAAITIGINDIEIPPEKWKILDKPEEEMTLRLEQLIRNYDPCISCATHFLKLTWEKNP